MATPITVISQPENWTPVYNPMIYTVTSTNVAECNFKYIVDIYVRGNYITTIKLSPNLSNEASFEINRVLQNFLSFDINYNILVFTKAPQSHLDYEVHFGEEYDTSISCDGSGHIIDRDLVVINKMHCWNGSLGLKEFVNYNIDNFVNNGTDQITFLTNQPKSCNITPGSWGELSYIQQTPVKEMWVITFDTNGLALDILKLTNTEVGEGLVSIPVGMNNLQESFLQGLLISSGSLSNIWTDDVSYYWVVLTNGGFNFATDFWEFKIDKSKTINPTRFYWLGQLGNMDSFTFTLMDQYSINSEKNEFMKLNGLNKSKSDLPTARGRQNIYSRITEKYTSNSGWMTETEAKWISELFSSTEVYTINNPIYCFGNANESSFFPTYTIFYVNQTITDIKVGDVVYLSIDDTLGVYNVLAVDGDKITIEVLFADIVGTCGNLGLYIEEPEQEQLPVIITDSNYIEKRKRTTKNISYSINYELSNSKTIQHN